MPKLKPERIAGIVALSYLALIPVGGFIAWRRLMEVESDVELLWERAGYPPRESRFNFDRLKKATNNLRGSVSTTEE